MALPEQLFDLLLAFTLVWLCWRVLATEDIFKAVVLFIVFGLLMALAWARLEAPDIALAEAAIGAGLTGALMLDAAAQMDRRSRSNADQGGAESPERTTEPGDG
jgi:energy-converting hydrogenase B subunit D